jgi:maltokinase
VSAHPQRQEFLAHQRWFGGKGREFEVTDVRVVGRLGDRIRVELVDVAYPEGQPATETYQMPVVAYDEPQDRLGHALVREGDGEWTYDAVHDREAMDAFLQAFMTDTPTDAGAGVAFHLLPGHDLDRQTHSTLFSGQQSNSSVMYGEDAILKVFRKVTPGHNPDIEIHRALTEADNHHVAALYGWIDAHGDPDGDPGGDRLDLAMLQQFLRTATDGWELALASVRNLYAEEDLHAEEVGGDFAAEAHRLGEAIAEVHADLRTAFGSSTGDAAQLVATMNQRLDDAQTVVPDLAEHEQELRGIFAEVSAAFTGGPVALPVQRVHGDLHLGQTLRTSLGWKLVDFEGEPAKPLSERRLPDSPWRDVAGMLRSFDYAARSVLMDFCPDPELAAQLAYRAQEWTTRNHTAFLAGYAPEGLDGTAAALVAAYQADKAIYECGYEARNRPGWLELPLQAIARLGRLGKETT